MLKIRIIALSMLALCLILAAVPSVAGDLYDNGPINGNVDAWPVNTPYVGSDTFTLSSASTVNGVSFGAWLFPGDTLTSAEVSITSGEFGGTTYFDGTVSFGQGACFTNSFGYNVCTETGSFAGVNLNAGTYWLNLENASVPSGNPVLWDENSGPSQASETILGTIPSEAFTIIGGETTTTSTGTTPEPGSIMLFGSGILCVVGLLRRNLF